MSTSRCIDATFSLFGCDILAFVVAGNLVTVVIPRPRGGEDVPGLGKVCHIQRSYL